MNKWWPLFEKDLKWRQDELAELKLIILRLAPPGKGDTASTAYRGMLRASWAMLYAHYEGFCLFAFTTYLDNLEKMKIPRGEFEEAIFRYSLEHHLPATRSLPHKDYCDFLRNGLSKLLSEPINFPKSKKRKDDYELAGRSNLWPKNLVECAANCSVALPSITEKDTRLKLLVGRRNDIAHGKETPVKDHDEYLQFEKYVLDVIEAVAKAVDDALRECSYLSTDARRNGTERLAYAYWQSGGQDPVGNWFAAKEKLSEGHRV